jgi:hypothetical protein
MFVYIKCVNTNMLLTLYCYMRKYSVVYYYQCIVWALTISASQIIEKHREFNIVFIDFKKAFDSVDRDKLWTIMSSKGIPTYLLQQFRKHIWKTL